jgi:hypothetical protein
MVQIGSVGGALIAFIACDKIGVSSIVENYLNKKLMFFQVVCGLLANSASSGSSE